MTNAAYRHLIEIPESLRSAERVVPYILQFTGPIRSVVDVGGGSGAWARAFQEGGAEHVLLLDCEEARQHLVIDEACFQPVNLNRELPAPELFDLAICLECAEHLSAERAEPLVKWLTTASDLVVFSAAVPGQGGRGHINEQSPDYWLGLFDKFGFVRRDVFRSKIIHDSEISWWYRQNLFVFVRRGHHLASEEPDFIPVEFQLLYHTIVDRNEPVGFRMLCGQLFPAFISAIRRRFK